MSEPRCVLCPLPDLAAIAVSGPDAEGYLRAQLSQVPPGRDAPSAPLAAWHDAKGRVQALFRILRRGDDFLLLTHASVATDIVAALRRYVLRARVQLEILATHDAGAAIIGDCTGWLASRQIAVADAPGTVAACGELALIRLGPRLLLAIGTDEQIEHGTDELPRAETNEAELAEIRLGLPIVEAATRGEFLPQMLNLERLGAIALDKGCYPGQEVIARTQNLGSVKRRMIRLVGTTPAVPAAGARILDAEGHHAGTVVRAARAAAGFELLAVVMIAAAAGRLGCELPDGTSVAVEAPLD